MWGAAEADIEAAGGFALADGYTHACSSPTWARTSDAIKEIVAMYEARGRGPAGRADGATPCTTTAACSSAALLVEALRKAVAAAAPSPSRVRRVKAGLETLTGFSAGGLGSARSPSAATDHEGGGFTRVYQVKDGEAHGRSATGTTPTTSSCSTSSSAG